MKLAHEYKYGALVDLPIYDATSLARGQSLIWGQEGSSTGSLNALVDSAAVPIDIFGVLAETPTTTTTNYSTPIVHKALVQLATMMPVWRIYWDNDAANDIDVTSSTSTVLSHASGDDNLDGCWVYINSGTGAGQLRFVTAANATTKTVNTAFTTTPDSTSDFLLIRGQGLPTGGQDLDGTFSLLASAVSATGQLLILKNWIQGPPGTQELDVTLHELDNLNARSTRFYSDVCFLDRAFSTQSI